MDMKEGLDFLVKDRSVIHISEEMLKGFFLSNPFHNQKLKIFGKEKPGNFKNLFDHRRIHGVGYSFKLMRFNFKIIEME